MKNNTIRFPVNNSQRRKNALGTLNVECQVSGRILHFHNHSDVLQGGEFITIDVMAIPKANGRQRKICQVVVTREDVLNALKNVHPEEKE